MREGFWAHQGPTSWQWVGRQRPTAIQDAAKLAKPSKVAAAPTVHEGRERSNTTQTLPKLPEGVQPIELTRAGQEIKQRTHARPLPLE